MKESGKNKDQNTSSIVVLKESGWSWLTLNSGIPLWWKDHFALACTSLFGTFFPADLNFKRKNFKNTKLFITVSLHNNYVLNHWLYFESAIL